MEWADNVVFFTYEINYFTWTLKSHIAAGVSLSVLKICFNLFKLHTIRRIQSHPPKSPNFFVSHDVSLIFLWAIFQLFQLYI